MGLLHDVGKATPWFQAYLDEEIGREDPRTRHSLLGATIANHLLSQAVENGQASRWLHWAVVAGIQRHHGDFDRDVNSILTLLKERAQDNDALQDQLEAFDVGGFRSWLLTALEEHGISIEVPEFGPRDILDSASSFYPSFEDPLEENEDGFDLLASFGAFVGADKMHTAHPGWERHRPRIPVDAVRVHKEATFGPPEDDIDQLREDVYDEVLETLDSASENWVYSLTAPTGSGKTFTSLAAALALRDQVADDPSNPGRIVYCLPLTSIIDQNSDEYEKVLRSNDIKADDQALLTHHHLSDPRYRVGDEHVEDGSDLLVETWQSEIVVTTFHQLVYTLFTGRNTNLKRMGALSDSIVILDEVQAIPHEYWDDIRRMMEICADRLGTTFLLTTATMPLIVDRDATPELLPSHPDRYEKLARTVLENRTTDPVSVDDFAESYRERVSTTPDRSRIVLVNRRKTARRLYRRFEDLPVATAMLSADLTPLDRRRVIASLEDREDPYVLVSTQVIEAGVDISADEIVRDLSPLDALIQTAGRCNRERERDRGTVEVVQLRGDDGRLATPPYSSFLVETTMEVLGDKDRIDESSFHELARRYYKLVHDRGASTDILDRLSSGDLHRLGQSDGLRLIEERPTTPHFIIQDTDDRDLWESYLDIQNMEIDDADDLARKRRRFQTIKRDFYDRVVNYPADQDTPTDIVPVEPEDHLYDPETGLRENKAGWSYEII